MSWGPVFRLRWRSPSPNGGADGRTEPCRAGHVVTGMGMLARGLGHCARRRCGWSERVGGSGLGWRGRLAAGLGVGWLGLIVVVASAYAAFPGRDGLLAVQPRAGGGIVLVAADGRGERRICVAEPLCGTPRRPRWSGDGRALVFAGPGLRIVYPDGSCLDCQFGAAINPAFEPSGTVVSFIDNGRVAVDGIDGIRERARPLGAATDAVWSAEGRLAVVRAGVVWAGLPGRLRKTGIATEPSWSPSGREIAAVKEGWVVIMRVDDGPVRRLVRGTAPAFSPDGRWIAFVAPDHRLMIVHTVGAHPVSTQVGDIQAVSVDWQPQPERPNPGCRVPPGSTILASSRAAIVTGDGLPVFHVTPVHLSSPPLAYMGCLRASGRERLLERFNSNNLDGAYFIASAVVAAPYAALVLDYVDPHYGGQSSTVQVFDYLLSDDGGFFDLLSSSDPSADAGAWTAATVATLPEMGPFTVACPSASLCVAAGPSGIYTSTDPTGGASAWRVALSTGLDLATQAVSCPSTTLCVVSSPDGVSERCAEGVLIEACCCAGRFDP
jgi:WD40-like Beta Propeller Repeat